MKIYPRVNVLFNQLKKVVTVTPDEDIKKATSLMAVKNISQLVVLQDCKNNRRPEGILSWKSIGIKSMYDASNGNKVKDYMNKNFELIHEDENLLKVSEILMKEDAVLVINNHQQIKYLITATDFAHLFHDKIEPFILLESVEKYIRFLIEQNLSINDINNYLALKKENVEKPDKKISDLTFFDYRLIFSNPDFYKKMKIPVNNEVLISSITKISEFRNKVMHFKISNIDNEDLENLRTLTKYLRINYKISSEI